MGFSWARLCALAWVLLSASGAWPVYGLLQGWVAGDLRPNSWMGFFIVNANIWLFAPMLWVASRQGDAAPHAWAIIGAVSVGLIVGLTETLTAWPLLILSIVQAMTGPFVWLSASARLEDSANAGMMVGTVSVISDVLPSLLRTIMSAYASDQTTFETTGYIFSLFSLVVWTCGGLVWACTDGNFCEYPDFIGPYKRMPMLLAGTVGLALQMSLQSLLVVSTSTFNGPRTVLYSALFFTWSVTVAMGTGAILDKWARWGGLLAVLTMMPLQLLFGWVMWAKPTWSLCSWMLESSFWFIGLVTSNIALSTVFLWYIRANPVSVALSYFFVSVVTLMHQLGQVLNVWVLGVASVGALRAVSVIVMEEWREISML